MVNRITGTRSRDVKTKPFVRRGESPQNTQRRAYDMNHKSGVRKPTLRLERDFDMQIVAGKEIVARFASSVQKLYPFDFRRGIGLALFAQAAAFGKNLVCCNPREDRAIVEFPAAMQDDHAVANPGDVDHVVRDYDDRVACLLEIEKMGNINRKAVSPTARTSSTSKTPLAYELPPPWPNAHDPVLCLHRTIDKIV